MVASTRTARPRPRDVPGYAEALAAGRVPSVPATPPSLLRGPSAAAMFRQFLVGTVVVVVAWFLVLAVTTHVAKGPGTTRVVVMVPAGLIAFTVVIALVRRVGRRNQAELAHCYTTIRLTMGGFSTNLGRMKSPQQRRADWNYAGVWVLDGGTGRVVSAPDPSVDPPGFFPSPHRQGALEFWTGAQWTGEFR
jgi:hypothetical protein